MLLCIIPPNFRPVAEILKESGTSSLRPGPSISWKISNCHGTRKNGQAWPLWIAICFMLLCIIPPNSWWRHQMKTFSALMAICAGNSPGTGEFPTQRPVTQSFDVFFDLRLNKRLSKQSWGWWLEMLSRPLWRHRNVSAWYLKSLES